MDYRIQQIADLFFLITKDLKRITEKSLKDYGLGIGQLQVLLLFYKEPTYELSQVDLAKALNVDKGNISRNVSKLVNKNYITPTENNSRYYTLTKTGMNLKGDLVNFFATTHQKMIEDLSEEELLITFNCLLKINNNLEVM